MNRWRLFSPSVICIVGALTLIAIGNYHNELPKMVDRCQDPLKGYSQIIMGKHIFACNFKCERSTASCSRVGSRADASNYSCRWDSNIRSWIPSLPALPNNTKNHDPTPFSFQHIVAVSLQVSLTPFLSYITLISAFGFYNDSSLFTSTVMRAGTCQDRHFERKSSHSWILERIGALKTLVVSGFKPRLLVWQASALSIALCPSGKYWGLYRDPYP